MPHSLSDMFRIHGESTKKQWESMLGQNLTYMGTGMEPEGHGRGHGNGGKQVGKPWECQPCFVLTWEVEIRGGEVRTYLVLTAFSACFLPSLVPTEREILTA